MNSHLEMWPSTFNQLVTLQFNMHGFNLPYRDARALKCLYTQPHQRCVDNYRLRHLWCCIFNSFNQLHTYLFIRNCTKSFTHRFRIIQRQIAHTSALEMTQLLNVLITDNSTIKANYRWSKHPIIVSFLRQIY